MCLNSLAHSELEDETIKDNMAQEYKALASTGGLQAQPRNQKKSSKGLRRFFNR